MRRPKTPKNAPKKPKSRQAALVRLAVEERRVKVAKLHAEGLSNAEIARRLDCSQQVISFDLQLLRKRWGEATEEPIATAKLANLERTLWESWHRSCEPGEEGLPGPGDPRLLETIARLIELRLANPEPLRRVRLGPNGPVVMLTKDQVAQIFGTSK